MAGFLKNRIKISLRAKCIKIDVKACVRAESQVRIFLDFSQSLNGFGDRIPGRGKGQVAIADDALIFPR